MKTIELDDRDYVFLVNLANEIKTQDNRATASPYFYVIQETERIYSDEFDDRVWVDENFDEVDEKTVKEAIKEWKADHEGIAVNDAIIAHRLGYSETGYVERHTRKNAFLTEKAIKTHIAQNSHHYKNPMDFLDHAFRNPELERLIEIILKFSGPGK